MGYNAQIYDKNKKTLTLKAEAAQTLTAQPLAGSRTLVRHPRHESHHHAQRHTAGPRRALLKAL